MFMNILIIVFVLGISYAWMIRGMFSSLLHLLCVIVAGALAFAFWEPLALLLIGMSPERGFLSFIESIAWGTALVLPFAIELLLLRLITDRAVSGNISNNKVVDYIGGGVCGVATASLTAGILVLGIGSMRVSTNFLGYQPLWYSAERSTGAGSLVKADSLWLPVDKIVATMYGNLSTGAMSTAEPLNKWYPELTLTGFASRVSPGDGGGRNALSPDDFKIKSTYTVGSTNGSDSVSELLKDVTNDQTQRYLDINSEPVSKGHIAGYVIEFEPSAKERGEKGGQLIVSNGQYRLLVEDSSGDTQTVFPIATISESSQTGQFGRWRFDANDVFITSVGGKSRVQMAFEYVIPSGFSPIALYLKNIRVDTASMPKAIEYTGTSGRDSVVLSGAILKGDAGARVLNTENMVTYDPTTTQGLVRRNSKIGEMMSTQVARRGMTLNSENEVVDGIGSYSIKTDVGRDNAPQSRKLRVSEYAPKSKQVIIRVEVSAETEFSLFSEAARDAAMDVPLLLIDTNGNEYEAIGYEYADSKDFKIRYTPGSTLGGLEDTPNLSRSRSDQTLIILFIVTTQIEISHFAIGDLGVVEFVPPFESKGR